MAHDAPAFVLPLADRFFGGVRERRGNQGEHGQSSDAFRHESHLHTPSPVQRRKKTRESKLDTK
jgi:hypothetical protein